MPRRVYDDPEYRRIRKEYASLPCRYCGKHPTPRRPTTVHHLVSVRRGGGNTPSNLVPACQSCNNKLAAREARTLGVPPGVRARRRQGGRQLNRRAFDTFDTLDD